MASPGTVGWGKAGMTRTEFNRKTRRQAIDRAKGACQKCGAILKPGEAEVDHIIPSEMGGEATVANAQVLCSVCHRAKTTQDVRRIRKSDRARDKSSGAIKSKHSIPSPPKAEKGPGKTPLPPRRLYKEKMR